MLVSFLPLLPPPSSSPLPPHHAPTNNDSAGQSQTATPLHHQRRKPHSQSQNPRSTLAMLSLDERTITQRKLAIAMYGYSWLKPAGCNKTMLGRREEEIEREEVERQLREVEMQERNAFEAEEAERQARLEAQGEEGVDNGERDLDGEVPDMDAEASDGEEEEEAEEDVDEEDEEVDLDDEVPEADTALESSWVYDTRREPDTDEEGEMNDQTRPQHGLDRDQIEQEALMNAMLDEDELGEFEHQHDLDDEVPDMDVDMDMDVDEEDADGGRDLDDDVPEPEDEWQHTDTELEESEMDISILPPTAAPASHSHPQSPNSNSRRSQAQRYRARESTDSGPHVEIRRISGNMLPPPPPPPAAISATGYPRIRQTSYTPRLQTPASTAADLSIDALISSSVTGASTGPTRSSGVPQPVHPVVLPETSPGATSRRNFFNPAGARRNLFGGLRGQDNGAPGTEGRRFQRQISPSRTISQTNQSQRLPQPSQARNRTVSSPTSPSTSTPISPRHLHLHPRFPPPVTGTSTTIEQSNPSRLTTNTNSDATSLFTPPTRITAPTPLPLHQPRDPRHQLPDDNTDPPQSRTRSGRLLGGIARRRRDET